MKFAKKILEKLSSKLPQDDFKLLFQPFDFEESYFENQSSTKADDESAPAKNKSLADQLALLSQY